MQATSVTIWDEKNKKRRLWIIALLTTPLIFLGLVKAYYALHPLQGGFLSVSTEVIYPDDEIEFEATTLGAATSIASTSPQPATTLNSMNLISNIHV